MRRAIKNPNSKIVENNLVYKEGDSNHNKKIAEILFEEQKGFCAYTDESFSRTDAKDIEHFNPTLKGSDADNYHNWFLVKHQWNKEKSYKWEKYQPVLHPTVADFEDRVVYSNGDYFEQNENDIEAYNLVKLLKLDDQILAEERKKYIKRKKDEMIAYNEDAETFFSKLLNSNPVQVSHLRAIKEEFGVDIFELI